MQPGIWFSVGLCLLAQAVHAAEEPLKVGDRACLFLDDHFIAVQAGLTRAWHQGQPRPEVVVKDEGRPWEKWPHMFGSVLYDPEAKLYRMYYESAVQPSRSPPNSFTTFVCYAESADGKTWTKPTLNLWEDLGSKENNIVVHCAELAKVFVDPLEKDPAARLKMFVYLNGQPPLHGGRGECLLASGDGLKWKFLGGFNKPEYADPAQGNFTDSLCFNFDPMQRRYMAFIRTFDKNKYAELKDGRRRAVGMTFSKEVNKGWSPIVQVLAPDETDDAKVAPFSKDDFKPDWAEHYVMPISVYGNHYLGMLSLLYLVDGADINGGGDLQLTFSHDGEKWFRHPERQTLIAPSNAAPALFPTYISGNGPLEIGGELWLYYTEANGAHPIAPYEKAVSQIRAAVWRKDGFVSLNAGDSGELTTKPLLFDGNQLVLNVNCAEGGSVRAAILNAGGKPIDGFGLDDCIPLTGDSVRGVMRWKNGADLSVLQGKPILVKLQLARANLYGLRFSTSKTLKIVCLGDSVTKGVNSVLKTEQTFCSRLEHHLNATGGAVKVVNSGVGSDTTELGLKRFERDVLDHQPTHVAIMFGLNDAYRAGADKPPLVELAHYGRNLREMIRISRERKIQPVLMTSNPYLPVEKNVELKLYVELCRSVSREAGVPLIDVYAGFAELDAEGRRRPTLYSDGDCHLNAEGNEFLTGLMLSRYDWLGGN